MLTVLRRVATGTAAGLLLAVMPATAQAQDTDSTEHTPASGTDDSAALSDVTGLVGAPLNAGIFG
ncbi:MULTISPECIES: hypothetical protein [Streptomyces]|uniref:hypothetical protein n=1 Tax=Streptomyces TaxID=1883 RepID=UPI000A8D4608|nr:hypothetical protein [Streptomyces durhamensis]